jgi:hypothetical protein
VGDYEEFLRVSRDILTSRQGDATKDLGLDELLDRPNDPSAEVAGYAYLEAQGFTASVSSVLSRVALADPVLGGIATHLTSIPLAWLVDDRVVPTWVVFGDPTDQVLVDLPDRGLVAVPCSAAPAASSGLIEDTYAHLVIVDPIGGEVLVPESTMRERRSAILARQRLGAAAEMLGAADRMIEDALRYTEGRIQFGRPLATFPAIRDLLAWAATERHQLREYLATCWSLTPLTSPADDLSAIAKALAGVCGLKIAQATMQATGAMAFTAEYGHGALYRRILALDTVAGSCTVLNRQIGAKARLTGELPSLFRLDQLATSLS